MKRFDCLKEKLPLFGFHLLEASAGTGKTFSIEHIFVRLILESIEFEQILVVTFTRAATRELKMRIRKNLEKAIACLQEKKAIWDYLKLYIGSKEAESRLMDASAIFDRAQIFTIHGFCYRVLKEFAFEARMGSLSNPDEGRHIPDSLKKVAIDFLDHAITSDLLSIEQVTLLFKEFDSKEALLDKLLRLEEPKPSHTFSELLSLCKAALHTWSGPKIEEEKLFEDFEAIQGNFKKMKGKFLPQVKALANLEEELGVLLKEKGSLFDFLHLKNQKVRVKEVNLNYPGFFEWAREKISPLTKEKVFPVLQKAFKPIAEKFLSKEDYLDPDQILLQMKEALKIYRFKTHVQNKYRAAIIDEFQDTDALQWGIFQNLFIQEPIQALYLVGDPKQSIYRFRKADVYIYLKAKEKLGEEALYHLDTNFRSSEPLISTLNALFQRDWLDLPKEGKSLPYHEVKVGAKIETNFSDEKGAIHFFVAKGEPGSLFDEVSLPLAVREIEALNLKNAVLLVKDRYQIEKALMFLKRRGIPAVAKSYIPLGQTAAFQAIKELFEATFSPRDTDLAKIVLEGPFQKPNLSFLDLKELLEEKGLPAFAHEFELDSDAMQIFELLFSSVQKEGFSIAGLKRFLKEIEKLNADEGGRKRMEVDQDAVQIMTMHISKGLEFDVVFALGLSTRTPESDEPEELDAEKKRQLYVAMTRAKKRLYIPIVQSNQKPKLGTHSPIELFSEHFDGEMLDELQSLSEKESLTIEMVDASIQLGPPLKRNSREKHEIKKLEPKPYQPCFLNSFTSLSRPEAHLFSLPAVEPSEKNLQTMPRGAETGVLIHSIFEQLFRTKNASWCEERAIDQLVKEVIQFSILDPWGEVIQKMVKDTLKILFDPGFCLRDLKPGNIQVELEFIYTRGHDFLKGFIDLVFIHEEKIYFLDWKTNWLESYSPFYLKQAMKIHDYGLQLKLYREAIGRHFPNEFGGAIYMFVRGPEHLFMRDVEKLELFD